MIRVSHLGKRFKMYDKPSDRLKEIIFRRSYHHSFEALKDVSFDVKEGQTLGILGKNGAGKSTLLKIITGVLLPSSGEFQVDGRITGLLELGTGFDSELTGLQNIKGNGLLIGMSLDEIAARQNEIIEFSELGDFIHEPIRTYSSGMVMRLAFSIAMHAKPQCFVIDEALSVGDAHFQQKCMRHIKQFRENGGSIIFVSHDLNAVKMICDEAIVLDQGVVVAQGSPEYAVNHYNRIMAKLDEDEAAMSARALEEEQEKGAQNYGNQKARIESAEFEGEQSESDIVSCGENAKLKINIKGLAEIDDLTIGIMIRDRFGQDIFGTNSFHLGECLHLKPEQDYQAVFNIPMNIAPGKYTITIALHSQDNHIDDCYHWVDNMIKFEVAGIIGAQFAGVCRLDSSFEFSS